MCYKVVCKQCSKYSWGGCGNHLKSVYSGIEKGKHCMCRSWPGVDIPKDDASGSETQASATEIQEKGGSQSSNSGSCIIS